VAKTDTTTLSRGQDGILYKMAESRDWDKYRTLSEAEIRSELGKSRQIKEDMYTLQGKIKGGRMVRPGSSGLKVGAPNMGSQSRTRKIQSKAWERDIQDTAAGTQGGGMLRG
ncbi:hypothetical protein B484DRAFT_392773, partial [Ochromonadaceae sp. CCMP2298]